MTVGGVCFRAGPSNDRFRALRQLGETPLCGPCEEFASLTKFYRWSSNLHLRPLVTSLLSGW